MAEKDLYCPLSGVFHIPANDNTSEGFGAVHVLVIWHHSQLPLASECLVTWHLWLR